MRDGIVLERLGSLEEVFLTWHELETQFDPPLGESVADFSALMMKVFDRGVTLRARCGEKMAGAVSFYANAGRGGEAYISLLAVSSHFLRRGVASMLVESVEKEAAHAGLVSVRLEVRKANAGAISFYKARGFVEIGESGEFFEMRRTLGCLSEREKG